MRGGGRGVGDAAEVLGPAEYDAGATRPLRPTRQRIAHRPVERHAEAVYRDARGRAGAVHCGDRLAGTPDAAEADMGVLHDPPRRHSATLVFGLGRGAGLLEEDVAADAPVAGERTTLGEKRRRGSQPRRNKVRPGWQIGGHGAFRRAESRMRPQVLTSTRKKFWGCMRGS